MQSLAHCIPRRRHPESKRHQETQRDTKRDTVHDVAIWGNIWNMCLPGEDLESWCYAFEARIGHERATSFGSCQGLSKPCWDLGKHIALDHAWSKAWSSAPSADPEAVNWSQINVSFCSTKFDYVWLWTFRTIVIMTHAHLSRMHHIHIWGSI